MDIEQGILQLSGETVRASHLMQLMHDVRRRSLEAPIEDPPSDTFWWIEGCAAELSLRAPWVPVPDMQSTTPGA